MLIKISRFTSNAPAMYANSVRSPGAWIMPQRGMTGAKSLFDERSHDLNYLNSHCRMASQEGVASSKDRGASKPFRRSHSVAVQTSLQSEDKRTAAL